jgi:hypothetical protein
MIYMWKMNKPMLMVDDMTTRKRMEGKKSKKEERRPETIRIYIYSSSSALQLRRLTAFRL